jgi:hypothetical protein
MQESDHEGGSGTAASPDGTLVLDVLLVTSR